MQQWRDYFIFTGSVGATLLGLLFVAVSFNAEIILADAHRHLTELAGQTYQSFILVVLASLAFLFPDFSTSRDFLLFGILGTYGLGWVAYRAWVVLRGADRYQYAWGVLRRLLPAAIACLFMAYAGFLAPRQPSASALEALGSASAMLLVSATASSWDLLLKVGQTRRRKGPS